MTRNPLKILVVGMLATSIIACKGWHDPKEKPIPQLSAATPAVLNGSCSDLTVNLAGLADTVITSATEVAAGDLTVGGNDIPAHCLVTGKMHERVSSVDSNTYAIGFEMRLPLNWNGRFFHQGNGGIDGSVRTATGSAGGGGELTNALYQGFAVLSSDAGHSGFTPFFGIDPVARLDYGYTAVQKLTPMAKELIAIAYGKGPDRSYFGGCSNGGRHTFNAFARMPKEYDGYLAGAPGYRLPYAAVANIYGAQQYASVAGTDPNNLATAFTDAERATVAAAVVAKCDSLDGVTDGQIFDMDACQAEFSLDDVATCSGTRDGSCLSADQKTAIGNIFSGAENSSNKKFYSPFPFDSGIATAGYGFWEFSVPPQRDSGAVGFIWSVPPASLPFDGTDFVLNGSIDDMLASIQATDATYTEASTSFMIPPHNGEKLSAVRNRGAKIMVYHGVSDPIFSPLDTINWYNNLEARNDGDATDFSRLYLVPGMGHCSGGPAVDQFDLLTPLVQWVEHGVAPDGIIASARGAGNAGGENTDLPASWDASRTRPLCEYPLVARYDGTGDIESASSFSCQP